MSKESWRRVLSASRRARRFPSEVRIDGLLQYLGIASHQVASYVPFGMEPVPLVEARVLPRLFDSDGQFLEPGAWGEARSLVLGRRGWPGQPEHPADLQDIELILVPALALDGAGTRLGKGGGWYDRALLGVNATKVGVVYDDEFFPAGYLPIEAHDIALDGVVTPRGFTFCSVPSALQPFSTGK